MGGMLAQIVAARVPHAGLVLLSTAATASTAVPALDTIRTMLGVVTKWGCWEEPTRIDYPRWRWGVANGVPEDLARAEYAALVWDSGRVMAEMTLPNLSATAATKVDYAKLNRPALVIVGADDRTTVAGISRATARKLTGTVDYHELPGVGHWLFWGDTEGRVGDWIEAWLAQVASS
jgi:pimeloyl-ACP methyl ester carboxylesterase